ncbi:type I polyketide synthase [Streptomyces malaysiensis]|uniref:SDR family NAD(P)-dependent oxidoreductase n=1 Tax=Streptomyces malaysiensis subsp. samsunensis TaxID=459658 RepID=A0A9X2M2X3_STRMQ|nr:type I polyketide synthase [Streptomyces samsunensis]MCQ8834287.1 SDR family NAD(P)-dependent oxidoreductase [Streptomyces samsunensis]
MRQDEAEPIAVVGAACRLPGGIRDLDGLWEALDQGRDLVGEVPADRFDARLFTDPSVPRRGKSYTAAGGFLDDVAGFDAAYFGISPKEAAHMDPQHRLLLEMTAEALDDAAVDPATLAGSDTAVFVGISDASYGALQMSSLRTVGAYTMSGAASSIAANRVSHAFDLRGPSMAIDTACSSSLVALDRACRTLWEGGGRAAVCGGVNVLLSPFHYVGFSQASMLSQRGRCASFSARADGFVRAEGGGVVLLKRLSDALADGDRIHGLVLGTGSNSDGRTMGLALPNSEAQERLLREVYDRARVHPDELVYFEAHGTGTPVGDPLEALAIGRALGVRRISGALPIGSVKTNLGHLEPASGMAGLFKALLVLRHRTAPASLHADPPHPDIDFEGLGLRLTTRSTALAPVEADGRAVAGVNSFGFGGANAHAIVADAPPMPDGPRPPREPVPVLISARTAKALRQAAETMAAHLDQTSPADFYDLAHTSCLRRGRHDHRAVVWATTPTEAARGLRALAAPEPDPGRLDGGDPAGEPVGLGGELAASGGQLVGAGGESAALGGESAASAGKSAASAGAPTAPVGESAEPTVEPTTPAVVEPVAPARESAVPAVESAVPVGDPVVPAAKATVPGAVSIAADSGRVAFVFCGNGSQWAGMGADLFAADDVFRRAVHDVDVELAPRLGWTVGEVLAAPVGKADLDATEVAQPLLFAVQLGITAVLRDRGIEPAMVVGHSVGEVAAAHVCGALSLPDAARVIAERGRVQGSTAGSGRMAAVGLSAERAAKALAGYGEKLEIAGVNSAEDVTVAGDAEALDLLGAELAAAGVFFRDLGLDYAFHSRHMDPVEDELLACLTDVTPSPVRVPFYSTVSGFRARGTDLDAAYWWRNVRHPVLLADAVRRALADGAGILLEIGPHPVLRAYLRRVAARRGMSGSGTGTGTVVLPTLRRGADGPAALGAAAAAALAAGAAVDYAAHFPVPGRVTRLPAYPWQYERHWSGTPHSWANSSGDGVIVHPLLGERMPTAVPGWEGAIEPVLVPWLADHRLGGSVVMPATGYAEALLAAGRAVHGQPVEVAHLDISASLVVPWPDASAVRLRVGLDPDTTLATVTSTDERGPEPRAHARARVRPLLRPRPEPVDPEHLRALCDRRVSGEEHYAACAEVGLGYGPAFQTLEEVRLGEVRMGDVRPDEAHPGERISVATYRHEAPGAPYTVHPALLDGALQAGAALLHDRLRERGAYLPASIGSVRVWSTPSPTGIVWVTERDSTGSEVCWDITVADADGTVTARLEECRLRLFPIARTAPVTLHHTVPRAAPRAYLPAAPSPLPPPADILRDAAPRLDAVCERWREARYDLTSRHDEELTARSAAAALAGLLPDPAAPFTVEDLVAAGMEERHRPLIALLEPLLLRRGLLTEVPGGRCRLTPGARDTPPPVREALAQAPGDVHRIALATHLTRHLEEVLRGHMSALRLLTAEPAAHLLEQYYDTAPVSRFHNRLAQALLRAQLSHWPADRALRILEIGAGTGGMTGALLPLLPADRTRYRYTDVSPAYLPRARNRFGGYDFVEYGTFDLDRDPAEQGYREQGFDLVVAANALHTAKDLERALGRVASLLAPGGHLLAFECHDPETLLPVFGALDSFHHRTDTALRPESPLLTREQWPALLRRCGFTSCARTGDTEPPGRDHASVFLAAAGGTPAAAPPPPAPSAAYVVCGDTAEDPLPRAVAEALTAYGAGHSVVTDARTDAAAWTRALTEAGTGETAVVLVLGGAEPTDAEEAVARATHAGQTLRAVAEAHRSLGSPAAVRLWLVTRPHGAEATPGPITHPTDAAAWGVARCLANEEPDLRGRRLSLCRSDDPAADAARLVRELLDTDAENATEATDVAEAVGTPVGTPGAAYGTAADEDEIALTPHDRFVLRERALPPAVPLADGAPRPPYTLRVRQPGLSYRLAWEEIPPPVAGPGEVVVEVRAAALNYRDIMQTVGLLPTEALNGSPREEDLGLECAGVVSACGPGVDRFAPGDRVVGVGTGALSSQVVSPVGNLWPIPAGSTFAEAAGVPVAYCTVHYGLVYTARMRAGETVLVHGAAGGVGLAALQYARAYGATVIATAGSGPKRDLLRALGVEHVLDSRSLDFTVQVMDLTGGRGVDIVLNSLSGQALARGLEVLRPGGRFIELGKRDFYEDRTLPLRPFGSHISFHGVDLTTVLRDPRLRGDLLEDVGRTLNGGHVAQTGPDFHPLPHTAYPAARVADAFLLMRHSRHIGKVVVTFDPLDEPCAIEPASAFASPPARRGGAAIVAARGPVAARTTPTAPRLDPDASYLVTGGTSGFGAATAQWLAGLGARHLALVSRSGADGPDAAAVRDALAPEGARVTAYAADVADAEAMRRVLEEIEESGHPLRGVVHAAMALDDAPLAELTAERMSAVLRPKIGGARVLDTLTRGLPLDFFLSYSSTTAMVGNFKQSAYTAGNLYLEGLARLRRRYGEPALTLAWGAIGEIGYAARNDLLDSLHSLGIEPLAPHTALDYGRRLLGGDRPDAPGVVGVSRTDWSRAAVLLPLLRAPRLGELVPPQVGDGETTREELLRRLSLMDEEAALAHLVDQLTRLLAEVLHMDHEDLDPHRRLDSYGMDSLMAAQVLVSLNQRYELDIPPMELLRSNGTIAEFARIVQLRLGLHVTETAPVAPPVPHQAVPHQGGPHQAVPHQAGPDRPVTAGGGAR